MKSLKKIVKEANINPNRTHDWIMLTKEVIKERHLNSRVVESECYEICLASKEDMTEIEKAYYYVEEVKTSLQYIFEGHIRYV